MDRRQLTIRQRRALRRIAARLAFEDPALARLLAADRRRRPQLAPLGWWSPLAYVVLGGAFLLAGTLLEVGSAVFLGTGLCLVAKSRQEWLRRHPMAAHPEPDVRRSDRQS